jgi:hypothetical protein
VKWIHAIPRDVVLVFLTRLKMNAIGKTQIIRKKVVSRFSRSG